MYDISIAFICDDGFVMQTATAITSLVSNKNQNTHYSIYIITAGVAQKNEDKLKELSSEACDIFIVHGDMQKFYNLHQYNQGGCLSATESALLKFDLPQLLPHLDKVIYLDGDIIVRGDLKELYDIDVRGYYVAAAHDTGKLYFSNKFISSCPNYFNSGVMLLNLRLLRRLKMTSVLIETKKSLNDKTLMDQNVLNVAFKDHVKIIDIKWNLLILNLGRAVSKWQIQDLNFLFNSAYESFDDLQKKAVIIHFSSKEKPWLYSKVLFSREWFDYYKKSPFGKYKLHYKDAKNTYSFIEKLFSVRTSGIHKVIMLLFIKVKYKSEKLVYRRKLNELEYRVNLLFKKVDNHNLSSINKEKIMSYIENFSQSGISEEVRSPRLIVSLTSYPDRMYDIHYCLYSLLTQKLKPDAVVLWLAVEQFPNREEDVPQKVLALRKNGLTIKWCHDIKSYKKLIPALKEYPNDIIVTADDDIYYEDFWLEKLYATYLQSPKDCVIARRCHHVTIAENEVLPYFKWQKCVTNMVPSVLNFATGAGGILYPPHSFNKDVVQDDLFMSLAPTADDIWFWAMSLLNGRRYKIANLPNSLVYVNPQRELGLNDDGRLIAINLSGGNDEQMNNIIRHYPSLLKILMQA